MNERFQLNGIDCRFVNNYMDEGEGDPFESALSSMVSSPTAIQNEKVVLSELIGRLGTICNADTHTSSPPPNLMENHHRQIHLPPPFSSHPPFAQRNNTLLTYRMPISGSNSTTMVTVQESRDNKSIITRLSGSSTPENVELGDSRENSTLSHQIPSANSRKRKSNAKGKGKANGVTSENGESGAKRSKSEEVEDDVNLKPPGLEPPKDYIHVRARRGEATDAHSLAERVRREKISERMKLLQDLVPGCNKVTGKAVMLDEIINYVQSLQRQVEFLSMKLAVVNPRMDSKDLSWEKNNNNIYHWDHSHSLYDMMDGESNLIIIGGASETQPPFWNQSLHLPPCPTNTTSTPSQASSFWEDDLHSFVQMGFGQNQRQSNQATAIQMKVERSMMDE